MNLMFTATSFKLKTKVQKGFETLNLKLETGGEAL